ncbi:phosrestin-2 [Eurytemora carolleeae]|uniref:phosrestin-2 n=1 Tax=Eurytemora carolleeae TaxID=1294199 RepID=UPI000C785667|nr:phosrestin-2 [Eurytemora carolleeae]|eukprot:XP_023324412.1 phosrestin-2-like [Eurytemora affinis]
MTVTFRVFKKGSSDGRITIYLGRREFVDHVTGSDPIDGVVHIDKEFINDKKVTVQLICTFRYGREEDETMGLCFKKELTLAEMVLFPEGGESQPPPSRLQERLLNKMGKNTFPFTLNFPMHSPTSVILTMAPGEVGEPCGVEYYIRAKIASTTDKNRESMVNMAIRKIQYAPTKPGRQPCTVVRKDFALTPGELELEATLDRQLYYHGDDIKVSICVKNNSQKIVKKIVVNVVQCIDVAMFTGGHHTSRIFRVETSEGCPIGPGSSLQKQFILYPSARFCGKSGVAIDGNQKGDDATLASSTLLADENNRDIFGLVISYSVKVKLMLGAIGGELAAELPFVLMHPKPNMRKMMKADTLSFNNSQDNEEPLVDLGNSMQDGLRMEPLRRRNV